MHPCAKRAPPDARAWDGPRARAASSHEITGFNARSVQCLQPVPSRPCQLVDRSARVDLLVAAGWNQAPASPAHEWSMEADFERPCASQPSASTRWYVKAAGSAKVSGDGTRLGAPAPAGCPGCDPAGGAALASPRRRRRHALVVIAQVNIEQAAPQQSALTPESRHPCCGTQTGAAACPSQL